MIPGAVAAGVVEFVQREAAGAEQLYADGLEQLREAGFDRLAPAERRKLLETLEGGEFFETVRLHAIQGMFGDPRHGGNGGGAGWALLGYEGPKAVWTAEEQEQA